MTRRDPWLITDRQMWAIILASVALGVILALYVQQQASL